MPTPEVEWSQAVKTFRGGTAAELIPFHLDDGEDLVETLARVAAEMNLGSAVVTMGSGALSVARLMAAGTAGPAPLGVIVEQAGPLAIVSMYGWILSGQPELHLTLTRGAELVAGRAGSGCRIHGAVEGLLLRLGNLRLARVSDPVTGVWSFSTGVAPQSLPRFQLQGQTIDPQALLKVPQDLIERHRVLPLAISGDTLIVATADPHHLFAMSDLSRATGMRVQWAETPREALEAAVEEVVRWLRQQDQIGPR
jgi:predicted DNA-binding protein with PD1-like motif